MPSGENEVWCSTPFMISLYTATGLESLLGIEEADCSTLGENYMIRQLAHVCIHSADLDRTEDFYCRILGCSLRFEFFRKEERIGFYIQLGQQTFLEFFKGEAGPAGNIRHLALEVEDMDALILRLHEEGVKVGEKKKGADHSWQVWIKDPDGVDIEFHQYTPESLQLRGGICEVNW